MKHKYRVYETYHSVRSIVVEAEDEEEAQDIANEIEWDAWERDTINSWDESTVEELDDGNDH